MYLTDGNACRPDRLEPNLFCYDNIEAEMALLCLWLESLHISVPEQQLFFIKVECPVTDSDSFGINSNNSCSGFTRTKSNTLNSCKGGDIIGEHLTASLEEHLPTSEYVVSILWRLNDVGEESWELGFSLKEFHKCLVRNDIRWTKDSAIDCSERNQEHSMAVLRISQGFANDQAHQVSFPSTVTCTATISDQPLAIPFSNLALRLTTRDIRMMNVAQVGGIDWSAFSPQWKEIPYAVALSRTFHCVQIKKNMEHRQHFATASPLCATSTLYSPLLPISTVCTIKRSATSLLTADSSLRDSYRCTTSVISVMSPHAAKSSITCVSSVNIASVRCATSLVTAITPSGAGLRVALSSPVTTSSPLISLPLSCTLQICSTSPRSMSSISGMSQQDCTPGTFNSASQTLSPVAYELIFCVPAIHSASLIPDAVSSHPEMSSVAACQPLDTSSMLQRSRVNETSCHFYMLPIAVDSYMPIYTVQSRTFTAAYPAAITDSGCSRFSESNPLRALQYLLSFSVSGLSNLGGRNPMLSKLPLSPNIRMHLPLLSSTELIQWQSLSNIRTQGLFLSNRPWLARARVHWPIRSRARLLQSFYFSKSRFHRIVNVLEIDALEPWKETIWRKSLRLPIFRLTAEVRVAQFCENNHRRPVWIDASSSTTVTGALNVNRGANKIVMCCDRNSNDKKYKEKRREKKEHKKAEHRKAGDDENFVRDAEDEDSEESKAKKSQDEERVKRYGVPYSMLKDDKITKYKMETNDRERTQASYRGISDEATRIPIDLPFVHNGSCDKTTATLHRTPTKLRKSSDAMLSRRPSITGVRRATSLMSLPIHNSANETQSVRLGIDVTPFQTRRSKHKSSHCRLVKVSFRHISRNSLNMTGARYCLRASKNSIILRQKQLKTCQKEIGDLRYDFHLSQSVVGLDVKFVEHSYKNFSDALSIDSLPLKEIDYQGISGLSIKMKPARPSSKSRQNSQILCRSADQRSDKAINSNCLIHRQNQLELASTRSTPERASYNRKEERITCGSYCIKSHKSDSIATSNQTASFDSAKFAHSALDIAADTNHQMGHEPVDVFFINSNVSRPATSSLQAPSCNNQAFSNTISTRSSEIIVFIANQTLRGISFERLDAYSSALEKPEPASCYDNYTNSIELAPTRKPSLIACYIHASQLLADVNDEVNYSERDASHKSSYYNIHSSNSLFEDMLSADKSACVAHSVTTELLDEVRVQRESGSHLAATVSTDIVRNMTQDAPIEICLTDFNFSSWANERACYGLCNQKNLISEFSTYRDKERGSGSKVVDIVQVNYLTDCSELFPKTIGDAQRRLVTSALMTSFHESVLADVSLAPPVRIKLLDILLWTDIIVLTSIALPSFPNTLSESAPERSNYSDVIVAVVVTSPQLHDNRRHCQTTERTVDYILTDIVNDCRMTQQLKVVLLYVKKQSDKLYIHRGSSVVTSIASALDVQPGEVGVMEARCSAAVDD